MIRGDGRVDDSDTTLEAVVEVTFSSSTSKNLGLDNHVIAGWILSVFVVVRSA